MASGIRFARMARKAASLARCSARPSTPVELLGRTGIITPTPREALRHIPGVLPDISSHGMLSGKALFSSSASHVGLLPNMLSQPPCVSLTGKASYTTSSTNRAFGPDGPDGLPCYVDWRIAGAVTDVMDQGDCGCCWACTAVATIEAVNFKATGRLVKLSAQQLVDCVDVYADGCHGGSPDAAYHYVINNGGLVPDADYPFEKCKNDVYKPVTARGITIDGYESPDDITELELKRLVAQQPVAAVVGADDSFMDYTEGVLDGPNYTAEDFHNVMIDGSSIGHWVTVVGYGYSHLGALLWLIKNSYDTNFGWYGGYMTLARETGKPGGAFGITRLIAYPVKSLPNKYCRVQSETDMGFRRELFQ